jgi:hypothetical protein
VTAEVIAVLQGARDLSNDADVVAVRRRVALGSKLLQVLAGLLRPIGQLPKISACVRFRGRGSLSCQLVALLAEVSTQLVGLPDEFALEARGGLAGRAVARVLRGRHLDIGGPKGGPKPGGNKPRK